MTTNEKILELTNYLDNNSDSPELTKVLEHIESEWEKIDDEKYSDGDASLLASMMTDGYISLKNFTKAYFWVDIYLQNVSFEGTIGFQRGRVDFEAGDYESALLNFKKAFTASKGREFEGEDPKYLDFYRNPEMYMKK